MLAEANRAIKEVLRVKGERYIIDEHVPADGEYIVVNTENNTFEIGSRNWIKFDKKTRVLQAEFEDFSFVQEADQRSMYLESNKAVADKNIHSNNCYAFFVKRENIHNGKLTVEIIDRYYAILKHPLLKYKKPKAKELYLSIEETYGPADNQLIDRIADWVKHNLFDLVDKEDKEKGYLKIFFRVDMSLYIKESEKYLLANIYNNVDANQKIGEDIYGLPNDNMGMNAKKPYLEHKTRKVREPYLMRTEEVLLQKKLFDYLMNQANLLRLNIYISEGSIETKPPSQLLSEKFSGFYMRIRKGKSEAEIIDFDRINGYNPTIDPISFRSILEMDAPQVPYQQIKSLEKLKAIINEVFFNKYLDGHYFSDPKDIRVQDMPLKRNLLLCRKPLFDWFYKGEKRNVWSVLNKSSLDLIKSNLCRSYWMKASIQYELRLALKNYFEEGEDMADKLLRVKERLREKIAVPEAEIDSDEEYYFAIGQLANYLLSRSKSKNKNHQLASTFINARSNEVIKDQLRRLFVKYKYDIYRGFTKFNRLYTMALGYDIDAKEINQDYIIGGYLHSNLLYEKHPTEEKEEMMEGSRDDE